MPNTHTTLTGLFTDIADAIREKSGSTDAIVADNFPTAISEITTSPQIDDAGVLYLADNPTNALQLSKVTAGNVSAAGAKSVADSALYTRPTDSGTDTGYLSYSKLAIDHDGNIILPSLTDLGAIKVSPDGEVIWTCNISSAYKNQTISVAVDSNNNVFVGCSLTCAKISSDGVHQWTKNQVGGDCVCVDDEDYVYVTYYGDSSTRYFCKLNNSDGSVVWGGSRSSNSNIFAMYGMNFTKDGNPIGYDPYNNYVTIYPKSGGNYLKQISSTSGGYAPIGVNKQDGSIYIPYDTQIRKYTDNLASLVWTKTPTYSSGGSSIRSIYVDDEGYVYIASFKYTTSYTYAIEKWNADMTKSLWKKTFGSKAVGSAFVSPIDKNVYCIYNNTSSRKLVQSPKTISSYNVVLTDPITV